MGTFTKNNLSRPMDLSSPLDLALAIAAALLVLLILIRTVVFFVTPGATRDALRLAAFRLSARRNKKNHVFIGSSEYSRLLAAQILKEWKQ